MALRFIENVVFYEKMGYEHKKPFLITPKANDPVPFPFNAMVHGFHPLEMSSKA
jgi:hypothetical protein